MAVTVDVFSDALRHTLFRMPYNSAAEYLTFVAGEKPDARLGASCIHQTFDVVDRAVAAGAPEPVILQDERHIGAVFEVDGDVIVLDPYLLHLEPIRFPRAEVESGSSATEVVAAPSRWDRDGAERPAHLRARYKATPEGYVIRLAYERYSRVQGRYLVKRYFSLRSRSPFDAEAFARELPRLLTHPEQNSVSVRAVLAENNGLAEAIIPLRGFAAREFDESDIWLRASDGTVSRNGDGASSRVWSDLEAALGVSRSAVAEHLVSASRAYTEIADPDQELPPYPLENE